MYRRAAFYNLGLSVSLTNILNDIMKGENKWTINDLKGSIQKIEFALSIPEDNRDNTNYVLSCIVEAQEHLNKDTQYITVRNHLVLFLLEQNVFVVLGKERYVNRTIKEATKLMFPDNTENLVLFNSTPLNKDAIMAIIKNMRKDDQRSWCSAFNAKHDDRMWNDEKTRTDFSLAEGKCVLDHAEAQAEIKNANNIGPHYKFYYCPQLTTDTYNAPKTMRFSGTKGVVSTSIPFEFECWYAFIVNFLLPHGLIPR